MEPNGTRGETLEFVEEILDNLYEWQGQDSSPRTNLMVGSIVVKLSTVFSVKVLLRQRIDNNRITCGARSNLPGELANPTRPSIDVAPLATSQLS